MVGVERDIRVKKKTLEAAPPPHIVLLSDKSVIFQKQKPPEAAPPPTLELVRVILGQNEVILEKNEFQDHPIAQT